MSTEGLEPHSCRVAILCGGRGRRLAPATDEIPKALVELNGRPILDYVLDFYRSKGFRAFVLCVGYKAHQVRQHCEQYDAGIDFSFSDRGEGASMLDRIHALREEAAENLIVSYCDTFIDLDLEKLLAHHAGSSADATIVTARIRNPFGLVTMDDVGTVTSFVEKPLLNYYIGSFVVRRDALSRVTPEMVATPDGQGLVAFFDQLIEDGRMSAYSHEGPQITFNTESERRKAEEYLGKFYTYSESS